MNKYALSLLFLLEIQCMTSLRRAKSPRGSLALLKLECESLDSKLIRFPKCEVVKMNNNGPMVVNADIKFVQTIETVVVNAKLFRKVRKTFVAFLYDDVLNICDFLETNSKFSLLWSMLQRITLKHSNINHSCPFDHDIYLKNLSVDNKVLQAIPLPEGFYMIQLIHNLNGILASRILGKDMIQAKFKKILPINRPETITLSIVLIAQ